MCRGFSFVLALAAAGSVLLEVPALERDRGFVAGLTFIT
jgi:hypothetical protein